jgi:uncharacterized protein
MAGLQSAARHAQSPPIHPHARTTPALLLSEEHGRIMKTFISRFILGVLCFPLAVMAETSAPPAGKKATPQFLYVLRLAPRLHDDKAWTPADEQAVGRHFAYLQEALARRQLILAGRTSEPNAAAFGIVIFEAADETAARAFMHGDPAVMAKVMTAELHPYSVALQREK